MFHIRSHGGAGGAGGVGAPPRRRELRNFLCSVHDHFVGLGLE